MSKTLTLQKENTTKVKYVCLLVDMHEKNKHSVKRIDGPPSHSKAKLS